MTCRIAVIGAGNMGGAILRGCLSRQTLSAGDVMVVETEPARRREFASLGCRVAEEAAEANRCEQIMLAVKPQSFGRVAEAFGSLTSSTIIISIMAGIRSDVIREALGAQARVVRAMPNTPCQIGEGMTAIALGAGAKEGDDALARSIFESVGRCVNVKEQLMHAVTAVSGSGPAYVFLLGEAMEQAAMQLGLSHHDARLLVKQTLIGASRLLNESNRTADELRQAVTSPGGTTAAAMEVMFERELPQIVVEAIAAARDRGRDLDEATARPS